MSKSKNQPKARDAKTGRYITLDEARRRPNTTVVERDRPKPRIKKKRK